MKIWEGWYYCPICDMMHEPETGRIYNSNVWSYIDIENWMNGQASYK